MPWTPSAERDSRTSSSLKGLMIAVISFICRPSVLLPAPDERPALTNYQEAGQFLGGRLRGWRETVFTGERQKSDSKTGRVICPEIMQIRIFAQKMSKDLNCATCGCFDRWRGHGGPAFGPCFGPRRAEYPGGGCSAPRQGPGASIRRPGIGACLCQRADAAGFGGLGRAGAPCPAHP